MPGHRTLLAAAMSEPEHDLDLELADLEVELDDSSELDDQNGTTHRPPVIALPVVVRSTAGDEHTQPATVFLLALSARVQRLRDDDRVVPVNEIAPGMTLIGISEPERRTLFERIRPILADWRPQVVNMLLQLWRCARRCCGHQWVSDQANRTTDGPGRRHHLVCGRPVVRYHRIGPIDPRNIARIGSIGGSAVVAGEAARIAAVMQAVRNHHSTVGTALVKLARWHAKGDQTALDRAAETLGPDIVDIAAELTTWQVITVGEAVLAPMSGLRRPWSLAEATRLIEHIGDRGTASGQPTFTASSADV